MSNTEFNLSDPHRVSVPERGLGRAPYFPKSEELYWNMTTRHRQAFSHRS